MDSERRRSARYRFIADTEITEIASNTRLGGRTSDLSMGGCFLDMVNPSRKVQRFGSQSIIKRLIHCPWKSGFVFPNAGMGVVFTNVEEDQLAVLRKWLADLSGSKE